MFQGLAIGSAVATYATMVLGGYVSSTGAGLACPDWPFCHGEAIPDFSRPGVLAEFVHRAWAAATGVLIVAALTAAILWFRGDRRLLFLGAMSFLLLTAQITLGMVTITSRLDPVVVTSHLAIAAATFASTVSLAVVSLRAGAGGVGREPSPT